MTLSGQRGCAFGYPTVLGPHQLPGFSAKKGGDHRWTFGMIMGIVNLLSGLSSSRLVCHTRRMSTPSTNRYKNNRFHAEIIRHGVWLYFRFGLSCRDV